MKKIGLLILTLLLSALQTEAAVVVVQPGATFSPQQPIQAVVIDSSGNPTNQTFYYNSAVGGVDVNTAVGPDTSIYFPDYGTRYIWYNGYWVDQGGYYWNDGRRFYVGHPHWNDYWGGYWRGHGGWHDGWHNGWHGGDWHGHDGWHGGGWHGDHGGWHGGHGGWHGGDHHGGGHEHHGGGGGEHHGGGGHGGGGGHHR